MTPASAQPEPLQGVDPGAAARPTIALRNLTARRAGAVLVEGLSFTSSAQQVAVVGDHGFLPRLVLGEAELSSGELELAGVPARLALVSGVRLVPAAGWLVDSEPLLVSAQLTLELLGVRHSAQLAKASLAELGLLHMRRVKPAALEPAERRALSLHLALATQPLLVILEQPLDGLDDLRAAWLLEHVRRAIARPSTPARPVPRLVWTSERLITRAQFDLAAEGDIAWLRYGRLLACGPASQVLAAEALCVVRVRGDGAAFHAALTAAGVQVEALSRALEPADSTAWRARASDRPALVQAAVSSGTPVIELAVVEPLGAR